MAEADQNRLKRWNVVLHDVLRGLDQKPPEERRRWSDDKKEKYDAIHRLSIAVGEKRRAEKLK